MDIIGDNNDATDISTAEKDKVNVIRHCILGGSGFNRCAIGSEHAGDRNIYIL